MRVVSLFDGMACGMIAMKNAGLNIEEYIAYEIDKYAVQTATHNFPIIKECGDVFTADFTQYKGFDWVIGGSPCTSWSIAKTKGREKTASGVGWELFQQYVRAIRTIQPKYFIYENNKSMSAEIRKSISDEFGFDAICINSALVSAQQRQRLYWVGRRNVNGTYSRVNITQPMDKGIVAQDILDTIYAVAVNTNTEGKAQCLRATCYKDGIRNMIANNVDRRTCVAYPVNITAEGKTQTLKAQYYKNSIANFCCYTSTYGATGVAEQIFNIEGRKETVYTVKDGVVTVKGVQYPIKLSDGYYVFRKLSVTECMRLQTVPEWYEFQWVERNEQFFGEDIEICRNARLKDAISQLQTKTLNCVISTTLDLSGTEQQSVVESLSITKTNVKSKVATDGNRHLKVTVLCTTRDGNESNQSMNQKSALYVANQLDTMDAMGCVLNIMLNGCATETLCIPKSENMSLMETLGVNTTRQMTESGFIELLQRKCSEESLIEKRLFIISILINWIIAKAIYMSATTKPTFISIDSLSDWQHHLLKMELLSLRMGNIGGVSNSSAYKMLGNGWTIDVIKHIINECMCTLTEDVT